MTHRALVVALTGVVITGCCASFSQAQEQRPADAVRRARSAQNAALAENDIARAAGYWADNVVVTAGLGLTFAGAANYRRAFALDSSIVYERVPARVEESPDWPLVWEEGHWTGRSRGRPGEVLIHGRYSAMWVKVGDRWRIRSELFVAIGCSGAACRWPLSVR